MPSELADLITYACGQVESSASGYKFKAYFEFASQMRIGAVREWILVKPEVTHDTDTGGDDDGRVWARNFEARTVYLRDRDINIERYTRSELRVIPDGELIAREGWVHGVAKRGKQGERKDMDAIREILRDNGPQEGIRMVAEQFTGQFVRYASGITQLADLMIPKVPERDDFVLRPWQAALVQILRGPAHDRHIYWIEDGVGGKGKSRLCTYLCRTMNAIELDGKVADCAFAYASQPIVIFDLARPLDVLCLKELYTMAEKLKNGQLVSSKYQSKMKVFKIPHVIFFSNHPPPLGVWSADRLQHIVLAEAPPFQAHSVAGAAAPPPPPSGAELFKRLLQEHETAESEAVEQHEDTTEQDEEAAEYKRRKAKGTKRMREQIVEARDRARQRARANDDEGEV